MNSLQSKSHKTFQTLKFASNDNQSQMPYTVYDIPYMKNPMLINCNTSNANAKSNTENNTHDVVKISLVYFPTYAFKYYMTITVVFQPVNFIIPKKR